MYYSKEPICDRIWSDWCQNFKWRKWSILLLEIVWKLFDICLKISQNLNIWLKKIFCLNAQPYARANLLACCWLNIASKISNRYEGANFNDNRYHLQYCPQFFWITKIAGANSFLFPCFRFQTAVSRETDSMN